MCGKKRYKGSGSKARPRKPVWCAKVNVSGVASWGPMEGKIKMMEAEGAKLAHHWAECCSSSRPKPSYYLICESPHSPISSLIITTKLKQKKTK